MVSTFKKLLSYVYPITRKLPSLYNGTLEVTYIDGKKILNTQHANYSFGSLHKVMQFALHRIAIKGNSRILLLGLGGGSAVKIIRRELLLENPIDVVDIDSKVIDIANQEFGLGKYSNIEIYCKHAAVFVEYIHKKYGLIVIDLFIDHKTPDEFYEELFWKGVLSITKKKCCIVFNTLIANNDADKMTAISELLKNADFEVFKYVEVELWNTVLIAKRK